MGSQLSSPRGGADTTPRASHPLRPHRVHADVHWRAAATSPDRSRCWPGRALPQDAGRANEPLSALSADQQQAAIIGTSAPGDVVAGPGRQASLTTFQGIAAGDLTSAQQRLLWLLVQEFVHNADFDTAEDQLALVQQTWSDTHFAWQGPAPDPSARYYFRVHGQRILFEYDVQEPLTSNGGHVHAITRDPVNDYGMDWLGLHYHESSSSAPGGDGGPGPGPRGNGGPPGGGQRPTP